MAKEKNFTGGPRIRSGGQTGVDRAALDAAVLTGRPYEGWCPKGGWAEDWTFPSNGSVRLIWTVDRFRRGLYLRHGASATFFAGSGGGEGAMPRRCVSGTAIVGCCRRDWRGRFSRSLAQCRWCE